jgi:AcrR family transcriptional regulator
VPLPSARVAARRSATIEEALDHAEAIVAADGAGAVSVSEIARRMGMRGPSLYKYFPSLHAIYDALVERGNRLVAEHLQAVTQPNEPGLDRLLTAARASLRWSVEHPGLAPLLFWRPVPGFEPSPQSYAPSQAVWQMYRSDLAAAVARGQLSAAADSDDALRLLAMIVAGIWSQHAANEPDTSFETGAYTALSETAFAMFVGHFAPA